MPTALITDAARGSALTIIRALGRRGFRVIAASDNRLVPGFASRWVDARVRHPRYDVDLEAAADVLGGAAADADLVIPVTDAAIHALLSRSDALPPSTTLAVASKTALEATMDKSVTLATAERLGVPIPPTELAQAPDDAGRIAGTLSPPWVVKPIRSFARRDGGSVARRVAYATDIGGLSEALAACGGPALVQSWVAGVGVGVEVLASEGRVLAALQHRRVRETPWMGGASSCRETEAMTPSLLAQTESLIADLQWTGLAMVEFRRTGDSAVLMEINGRVWGSLPLAVRAGMDFPGRLADLLLSGPPAPGGIDTRYRVGVRARDLELERQWLAAAWRASAPFAGPVPPTRREAAKVAFGMLDLRGFDSLVADDPLPFAVAAVKAAGAGVLAFRSGLTLRRGGAG